MASKNLSPKIALTTAGSDSGGGAGIQANLRTFQQFGVFGYSVTAAVTAQTSCGVSACHPVRGEIVKKQMTAIVEDLARGATKIGMLATTELAEVVAQRVELHLFEN